VLFKTAKLSADRSSVREVLDCGDGACGVAALDLGGNGSDELQRLERSQSESGDFADSVTAVQDAGAPNQPCALFKSAKLSADRSSVREVLDCGDGACGVAALDLGGNGSDELQSLERSQSESGDFADSVTAVQDAGAPKPLCVIRQASNYFVLLFSIVAVIVASLLMLCQAFAAPGDLDPSFDAGSAVDGDVRAMVVQPDGKILIGGEFRTVKGFVKSGIARLNVDGSNDTSFNAITGPTDVYSFGYGYVQAIALQPDGKVLIGGPFDYVNGVSRTNIARLNADGTLDTSFDPGNGTYGSVNTFALQSDGKALIGGNFTKVNGVTRNYIARLNADGHLDTTFNPGSAAVGDVRALAVQQDGKVIFGSYDRIGRLNSNGSRDTTFSATVSGIYTIALQPDGKLLIGGGFDYVNGLLQPNCARLNTNGSLDMSFGDPLRSASPGFHIVRSMALQSDGKVLIGGYFSTVSNTSRTGIARLNSDGTLDDSFDPTVLLRDDGGRVGSLALQADGKVLITGGFKTVNGVSRYGMARLNPDATLDASFNAGSGVDAEVVAIAAQSDGKVLIGGYFDGVGGEIRSRFARLNPNGSVDASFDSQLFPYPTSRDDPALLITPTVEAITLQPDGKILVGSASYDNPGQTCDLVRLNSDGSLDASFNPVHGVNVGYSERRICVALQSDGKVLIGGLFNSLNGIDLNHIARLNDDGSLDASFNAAVTHDNPNCFGCAVVQSVAAQPDGKVIIAGSFTTVNGVSRTNFARLNNDGSLDMSFDTGANGFYAPVVLQPDGKVLVSGLRGITRLNADGSQDTSFNSDNGGFGVFALQPDGKIVSNGSVVIDGNSYRSIVRFNANGRLDTGFNSGPGGATCMALQADGRLLIGGDFGSLYGPRNYVARLFGGEPTVLRVQTSGNQLVLSWTNAGFSLQTAPTVTGTFTNLPLATSPYTNVTTGSQQFFRLNAN
jgi:uncharacterized delta-60 repeat protein